MNWAQFGRVADYKNVSLRYHEDAKELSDDAKEWVHRRLRYGWVIVGKLFVTDYAIEPFDV